MKVQMTGGSPWGFKMTGGKDFRQPLAIGKVTPGGKAHRAGIVEGHEILSVNFENVKEFSHLAAQNKIKATGQTLHMELSNAPLPKSSVNTTTAQAATSQPTPTAYKPSPSPTSYKPVQTSYKPTAAPTHYKSASVPASNMSHNSSSPMPYQTSNPHAKSNSYEDRNSSSSSQPDVEYHKIDHRESQRRMYDDTNNSEWRPSVHTDSKAQSPTFAALQRSGNAPHQSVLSPNAEKPALVISSEITDLIREEDENKQTHTSSYQHDGAMKPGQVKQYNPGSQNNSAPRPQYQSTYQHPAPPTNQSSYVSSYESQPASNGGNKNAAVGNISKFITNTGAKSGPPVFSKALNDLEGIVGDPAVLEIRVANVLPVPEVFWYFNGHPCRESKEKDIRFLSRGYVHTMVIGEFTSEFMGNYRCELRNKHGSTSCRCTLTAKNVTTSATPSYNSATTYNSSPASYQPSNNSYNKPPAPYNNSTSPRPQISNPSGLYSAANQQKAYEGAGAYRKPPSTTSRSSSSSENLEEESEVLKALRMQDEERNQPVQSRSMKMLQRAIQDQEAFGESEDL